MRLVGTGIHSSEPGALRSHAGRVPWLSWGILVAFALAIVRLVVVQLAGPEEILAKGAVKGRASVWLTIPRGVLVDRQDRLLATTIPFPVLEVRRPTRHPDFVKGFIAAITGLTPEQVEEKCKFEEQKELALQQSPPVGSVMAEGGWLDWFNRKYQKADLFPLDVDPAVSVAIHRIKNYQIPYHKDAEEEILRDSMKRPYVDESLVDRELAWLQDKLSSVHLRKGQRRLYLNSKTGSNALGYVSIPGERWASRHGQPGPEQLEGQAGVERTLDSLLRHREIKVPALSLRGRRGKSILPDAVVPPLNPNRVRLTMDLEIQKKVEDILRDGVDWHRARRGTALVMEVGTGNVLAMAQFPSPNPNWVFQGRLEQDTVAAWAVSMAYEPGSTIKPILYAIARDKGLTFEEEEIFCHGKAGWDVTGKGNVFKDPTPEGRIGFVRALQVSSNVFFGKLAVRMTSEELWRALEAFGFGKRTGVMWDPEEPPKDPTTKKPEATVESAAPQSTPWTKWVRLDQANVGRGHVVQVTPIQLIAAFNALANRGIWVNPVLVSVVEDADGNVIAEAPRVSRRVVSEEAAGSTIRGLRSVTEEGGTGFDGAIAGVDSAAKSGTAEKYLHFTVEVPDGKGGMAIRHRNKKMPTRNYASFVGTFPLPSPRYTVLVVIEEPTGVQGGGAVAGPIYSKIGNALLGLEATPNQEPTVVEVGPMAQPFGELPPEASSLLSDASPATDWVPDLRQMGLKKAFQLASQCGMRLSVYGTGVVIRQNPEPGTRGVAGQVIEVTLGAPEVRE